MPAPRPRFEGDFASAAMLRVLRQGLLDLGLPPPPPGPPVQGAVVSLDGKRAVLAHALQVGGLACLPLLGQGLHRFTHEPTHSALAAARDAQDLLQRWGRLERYIHSRHRVRLLSLSATGVDLAHVALQPHPAPLPAEDLVVLGVLLALLQACGYQDLSCTVGVAAAYPQPDAQALEQACARGHSAQWHIRWTRLLPQAEKAAPAARATSPHTAQDLVRDEPWPGWIKQAYGLVATRLPAPLDLDALAHALGQSRRSLQRGLKEAGLGFRPLQAEARYRTAGWHLMQGDAALAEIGFLCGYADQSHFTREFRLRSGLTPADFRREFGVG
ncbi:helix-turn-helix transcriptional regulator [Hylemonella sp. W303a]|uniref:helix-turn-helix transcriptional regulator n=1 Tax=Hylemonella sp. W303a TaxID=3389873 RepID=UPI00396B0A9D